MSPPGFLTRDAAFSNYTAELLDALGREFHKQPPFVATRRVLAQNNLALRPADLTDLALAVALVPGLLETEQVGIEIERASHVADEENGPRIPSVQKAPPTIPRAVQNARVRLPQCPSAYAAVYRSRPLRPLRPLAG